MFLTMLSRARAGFGASTLYDPHQTPLTALEQPHNPTPLAPFHRTPPFWHPILLYAVITALAVTTALCS